MVVLKPMFSGEITKTCPRCSHLGIGSHIPARSGFPRNSGKGSGYSSSCLWCERARNTQWRKDNPEHTRKLCNDSAQRRRKRMTPEQKEQERKKDRDRVARRKATDPSFLERRRLAAKEYRKRHKERLREERRIDRRLRLERKGEWKPPAPEEEAVGKRTGILLPCEPLANWLNELIAIKLKIILQEPPTKDSPEDRAVGAVVRDLRTTSRSLYRWRHQSRMVDISSVDNLTRNGGMTLDELYRNYGNGYSIYIASDLSYLRVDYWKPGK